MNFARSRNHKLLSISLVTFLVYFKVNSYNLVMGEANESFYQNLILESIRNNQEIPICRIENTPETPLTGSTPYLPSENIVNTSENMENVRPLSVENSHTKLENYIDEKYDQIAIKSLKEKILNEVKQQFHQVIKGIK